MLLALAKSLPELSAGQCVYCEDGTYSETCIEASFLTKGSTALNFLSPKCQP